MKYSPVAIGGVGGSGTRLIADILIQMGYYMGDDLNGSTDNLWYTLLFKRQNLWPLKDNLEKYSKAYKLFIKIMTESTQLTLEEKQYLQKISHSERLQHTSDWLQERALNALSKKKSIQAMQPWGWKEPNTHIALPELLNITPNMKYIHVMRHGLDMAYSNNQNQLAFWGQQLLNKNAPLKITPENSFHYWCTVHKRILDIGQDMGENFLLLNYDDFCLHPKKEVSALEEFLSIKLSPQDLIKIEKLISIPNSLGRYKTESVTGFNDSDLNFLQSLGYSI